MSSPTNPSEVRESTAETVRNALVTGVAVTVPGVVTLAVLMFVAQFVYKRLDTLVGFLVAIPGVESVASESALQILTPVLFVAYVLGVGFAINRFERGEDVVDLFDRMVEAIPIIGSIYESFRRMSEVVLQSDADNFREVKLIEFPEKGTYTIGFLTTETPSDIRTAADHEQMLTLFVPMAPNPVMGGHLVHVPEERVIDVEMSVEEGFRAIVTSGVANADTDADNALSPDQLSELSTSPGGQVVVDRSSDEEQ
jgi:uncharacterized membrane protein